MLLKDALKVFDSNPNDTIISAWNNWKNKFPDTYSYLQKNDTAKILPLDGYVSIDFSVLQTALDTYNTAQTAYKAALAALPGIGTVDAALTAAETALSILQAGLMDSLESQTSIIRQAINSVTDVDPNSVL